jgi:hypothetical protein
MKYKLLVVALAAVAMLIPASAAPVTFYANLSGPAEEPANASPGTGVTFVTIDPDAHTMHIEAVFANLLGTTTASHIHVVNGPGDADTSDTRGPVATSVPSFPGFPLGVTAGTFDNTFNTLDASSYNPSFVTNSGGTVEQAETELFSAITSGRAYLNIHSTQFPGGEIRGFLQPVPEPATVGLCVAALASLAVLKRRRRSA